MNAPTNRGGFTLVELVVALVVLTIGMMGMAAAAGYATTEVRSSSMRTQRTAVIAATVDSLRGIASTPYGFDTRLAPLASGSAKVVGPIKVWWDTAVDGRVGRRIRIYTTAPQYKAKFGWVTSAPDTFVVEIFRPVVVPE